MAEENILGTSGSVKRNFPKRKATEQRLLIMEQKIQELWDNLWKVPISLLRMQKKTPQTGSFKNRSSFPTILEAKFQDEVLVHLCPGEVLSVAGNSHLLAIALGER